MRANRATATRGHTCSSTDFAEVVAHDLEQSLVTRFADQVAAHADCLAVRDPERSLTYGELDGWANAIARAILDRGGGGAPVAILLPQGATNIAAIVGVLKAGCPYVSLDPSDPRSLELAERVGARVLVAGYDVPGRQVVIAEETASSPDPGVAATPSDIAYVYFTSGSTGQPKGVFDSHRNVLHNVLRYTNTLRIAPADRLSLIQSPAFSGTASSIFSALLNGASLLPLSLEHHGIATLARWLLDERVTIYHSVPAIFRSLLRVEAGPYDSIRVVRLEGDRASWADVGLHRRHFPADSVLVNGLGITETGLVRQFFVETDVEMEQGVLPVGHAVPGVDTVVLSETGEEAAQGEAGEIVVQSDHLALGYWGDPELTAASFPVLGGRRTYRTGDLGRFREDGCLEYLGRRDGRLKILGSRVEPVEVEAALLRVPGVRDATVATEHGRRGEGRLVAYVVPDPSSALDEREVREALRLHLPPFMIPSGVVFLDDLPLGPSGKVDRGAFSRGQPVPTSSPLPATASEREIARIWEQVLETAPIGLDDDFFGLGGDSLAAAEIVARLDVETGMTVPMSVLAGAPTVRAFAAELDRATARPASSLVVLRAGSALSPLVLLHGNLGHGLHYADLVRAADPARPIWLLEHRRSAPTSMDEVASRHLQTLLDADPEGPYFLAGFCYGGVVAHEVACRLVAEGRNVGLLALLGITPLEYPSVVSPGARRAWGHRYTRPPFTAKVRGHLRRARALPAHERPTYIGRRIANLVTGTARRATGTLDDDALVVAAFERALTLHLPRRFPGRALVVLHEDDTALYTDNPQREWAPLADYVEIALVPGALHAMLEKPAVGRLAELLSTEAGGGRTLLS